MQVVLIMFRTDGERRSFSVVRDVTIVGRANNCDLRIPVLDVSRKHCRLIKDGPSLRIEDLGSSNGTIVNGHRLRESIVRAGDTLQIGPIMFAVQIDGDPAEDELAPLAVAVAESGHPIETGNRTADAIEAANPEEVVSAEAASEEEAELLDAVEVVEPVGDAPTVDVTLDADPPNPAAALASVRSEDHNDPSDTDEADFLVELEPAEDETESPPIAEADLPRVKMDDVADYESPELP